MSSLFRVPDPYLINILNNSCLTGTALNKREYRVIVQLEGNMSEGRIENGGKKVERQRKVETDEKDLNQLKPSKSIRIVAASSRAEWLLSSSPVCLRGTFYLDPAALSEGRFNTVQHHNNKYCYS